jgi:hypothetical protein
LIAVQPHLVVKLHKNRIRLHPMSAAIEGKLPKHSLHLNCRDFLSLPINEEYVKFLQQGRRRIPSPGIAATRHKTGIANRSRALIAFTYWQQAASRRRHAFLIYWQLSYPPQAPSSAKVFATTRARQYSDNQILLTAMPDARDWANCLVESAPGFQSTTLLLETLC